MILKNLLQIGLILLIATCTSQNPQKDQSATSETTTTSVNKNSSTTTTTSKTQIAPSTSTTTEKSSTTSTTATTTTTTTTTTSQPKTELKQQNKTITKEQKITRGNTKYTDTYTTTTTTKPTISTNSKENKDIRSRQTTSRNDRSLNTNTYKYNPELHSENNIYAETQVVDNKKYHNLDHKDRFTTEKVFDNKDYTNFDAIQLTTPKDVIFDDKFRKMHEDISISLGTTPRNDIFDNKFQKMHEDISKSLATTPRDDIFDDKFQKMHEDISKSLDEKMEGLFNEKKLQPDSDNEEKPQFNNSNVEYIRFRNLEAKEAKDNKKMHKDYTNEEGMMMEKASDYNTTKIVDVPGIVVNTIPTNQKDSEIKKPDLDQGETKNEKISIEKPNTFISNKIENESGSEGSIEKPLEHKGIYLSKRGSTTQNKEQTIEKTLSTESGIPRELYPSKATTMLEENINNSEIKKSKILKKELDLDNKIPKFLTENTTKLQKIENLQNTSTESSEITTSFPDQSTSSSNTEMNTTEFPLTDLTTENDDTSTTEFFDTTDSTITEDTTTYTEFASEPIKVRFSDSGDDQEGSTETTVTETVLNNRTGEFFDVKTMIHEVTPLGVLDFSSRDENEANISTVMMETTTEEDNTSFKEEIMRLTTENVGRNEIGKKNESIPKIINEITKPPITTTTQSTSTTNSPITTSSKIKVPWESITENIIHSEDANIKDNSTKNHSDNNDTPKQNEININEEKTQTDECGDNLEDGEDYAENNCNIKHNGGEDANETEVDLEDHNDNGQISTQKGKTSTVSSSTTTEKIVTTSSISTIAATTEFVQERKRILYSLEDETETTTRSDSIVSAEDDEEGGNGGKIAAIVISTVGALCLLLLVTLLIIMKKRQKRFNYGQRCRPVSLDAYSMDNVSIHNSTRRKGVLMMSKRSYGNPAFEDPTSPSHLLNYSELLKFANNLEGIKSEFDKIPQVTTKTNELPDGCDVKNRYANVIPLPETRVFLNTIDGVHGSDYINANYVTGAQGARNYYIACQGPMQNTIEDFWRMIWEQQSKVILMLTHLYENGVEKCIDYLPPSEVLDCHRLFGDFQITLKKREVKDKYIISSLQLKNMVSNSWREITHFWYMGWPEKGVPDEANSLIAFLIEARSYIKVADTKIKETNNQSISNGSTTPNSNPVVVHCSPGTGRTGTVIACDIAVREFELTRKIDIPRIVYRVRRDRASAVQTKEQYCFIYKVIHFYGTKLTGGIFDSF